MRRVHAAAHLTCLFEYGSMRGFLSVCLCELNVYPMLNQINNLECCMLQALPTRKEEVLCFLISDQIVELIFVRG